MATIITLDIFSGCPNPQWVLSPKQESELEERMNSVTERTDSPPGGIFSGLGYRGVSVQRAESLGKGGFEMFLGGGILDPGPKSANLKDRGGELETWLVNTAGSVLLPDLMDHIHQRREKFTDILKDHLDMVQAGCPKCVAADAPAYDPAYWNNPQHQPYNNCYNYANNQRTDTFAQPGRATGKPITALSCQGVTPSAESDGLAACGDFSTPLSRGWYVALVIWPGNDYHWYRQDDCGCWSHKPGQTAACNTDNSGQPIVDPKSADRGPYTDFCTYMVTNNGVTIK